jgi:hypothetical protein
MPLCLLVSAAFRSQKIGYPYEMYEKAVQSFCERGNNIRSRIAAHQAMQPFRDSRLSCG